MSKKEDRKKDPVPEVLKEVQELREQQDFLARGKKLLQNAQDARRRYDYEWMVRDLFRRGYQFSRFQPTTQTVILSSRQQAKIPINLVAAQLRSIRNQATAFRPKWEVAPRYQTEESKVQARYTQQLLDYLFDHLKLKTLIKETVTQGLIFSVGGPWEVTYDEEKDEVRVWLLDPFDFYIDPLAESVDDSEFCIKAVRRPLSEVLNNPLFNERARKEIGGAEARLAMSEYKQFIIQSMRIVSQRTYDMNESIILFDGSFKVRKDGKVNLRRMVWTDQNITPLIWELRDDEEYDYVIYRADLNPKEIYGEGWMKHVMPINRVINNLESSVFEYNTRVAKGRIVVDKDSGVRAIHNVHGEIISKVRGTEVRALDMPSLPIAVSTQIERMNQYQQDIGAVHDSSLGRIPVGARSGLMVAELKQSDSCVDIETEALTKRGWKKYNEILDGEDIYLLDPKTKQSRWGKVNWIYWNDKEEAEMYVAKTKTISFLTTPDHSWMTVNVRGNWKKEQTQTLKNDQYIPLAVKNGQIPVKKMYSDDFVRLVSWVITEGTYNGISRRDKKNGSLEIRIYQAEKNMDKVEKIKELFSRLKINRKPYVGKIRGSTRCWTFSFAKDYAKQIRELFPTKSLTIDFVSQLTEDQLHILIDTMILGDGYEEAVNKGRRSFINTNKETIDAFQFANTLLGVPTAVSKKTREREHWKTCYVVYLKNNPKVSVGNLLNGKLKKIKFTGRIWCPNTETGYWLARKDGKVFYTGNTGQQDITDNLEDFLEEVARKILKKIAKHYTSYHVIRNLGYRDEDAKYFAVVGESSKKKGSADIKHKGQVKIGPDWLDLAIIGEDTHVKVSIGSWLGYTKEIMEQKILKFAEIGLIDQKTALKLLEFGNIDEIVKQTRIESLLKKSIQSGNMNQNPEEDQYGLALTENEMMVNEDKDMPVDPHDDHYVHIALHQEALGKGRDDLVGKHIQIHQSYLGQSTEQIPNQAQGTQSVTPPQGGQMPPPTPNGASMIGGGGGMGMPTMPQGQGTVPIQ
jgi:hypothetical protein